jgi:hypothetical protein
MAHQACAGGRGVASGESGAVAGGHACEDGTRHAC